MTKEDFYKTVSPISIICPTRDRVHNLERVLISLERTCCDVNNFEIIFICDSDDIASMAYLNQAKARFPKIHMSHYARERTEFLNRDYFNWALQFAKGKLFWVFGDDLEMVHSEWDKAIFDYLYNFWKGRDDRIAYISVKCDTPTPPGIDHPFACFPIMSREAVEKVGFFMIPEIPSWCSDYAISKLYYESNRLMTMKEQLVKHIGVETGAIIGDKVTERMDMIHKKYNSPLLAEKWEKEKLPNLITKLTKDITIGERRL